MIICLCHRVSDRDIAREARDGCTRFDDLQERLGVATACGACVEYAQACLTAHAGLTQEARQRSQGCAGTCGSRPHATSGALAAA
jgi:bacterioferritin-associated ferredoxin